MKTKKIGVIATLICAIALQAIPALAGEKGGNGGGGFICPNRADDELLDLFEAGIPGIVTEDGLVIQRSSAPVDEQIETAFSKIKMRVPLYNKLKKTYARIKQAKRYDMKKGYIAWPQDAVNSITKPGCIPTGLILYKDANDSMLIDEQSIAQLPNTDQAALWVHETVYKSLREILEEPDSVRARKIVAHFFSSDTPDQLNAAIEDITGHFAGKGFPTAEDLAWKTQPILDPSECPRGTEARQFAIASAKGHGEHPRFEGKLYASSTSVYAYQISYDIFTKYGPGNDATFVDAVEVSETGAMQVCLSKGLYYQFIFNQMDGFAQPGDMNGPQVYVKNDDQFIVKGQDNRAFLGQSFKVWQDIGIPGFGGWLEFHVK